MIEWIWLQVLRFPETTRGPAGNQPDKGESVRSQH